MRAARYIDTRALVLKVAPSFFVQFCPLVPETSKGTLIFLKRRLKLTRSFTQHKGFEERTCWCDAHNFLKVADIHNPWTLRDLMWHDQKGNWVVIQTRKRIYFHRENFSSITAPEICSKYFWEAEFQILRKREVISSSYKRSLVPHAVSLLNWACIPYSCSTMH